VGEYKKIIMEDFALEIAVFDVAKKQPQIG